VTWKFETRDLTLLWWQLKLTPCIMLQQNIWHIAKYQDNKNHPKCVQTAQMLQTFIFTFLLGIYKLKPAALFTNSMKKSMDMENVGTPGLEGLCIFHSKNVGEPIEYSRCLPLPCFNNFFLTQKNFDCFVRYKQYQPFCARTGGDALMKLQCSGLLPSTEVGLWHLKVEKGRIITFYFKTSTVDAGKCRTAPAALVKIAQ